jgi:hypothetical protein
MTAPSFAKDIKPIFAKYVDDMKKIALASSSGTRKLDLGDYESVKFFSYQIQVAIHGYDYLRDGSLRPGAKPLLKRGGKPDEYVTFAPHPMPLQPDDWPVEWVRLPQEAIDVYDQWVLEGMLA